MTDKPNEPSLTTCDWGDCDDPAIDSRWSDEHGWLPVCARHAAATGTVMSDEDYHAWQRANEAPTVYSENPTKEEQS
jgi:hypothetical protein